MDHGPGRIAHVHPRRGSAPTAVAALPLPAFVDRSSATVLRPPTGSPAPDGPTPHAGSLHAGSHDDATTPLPLLAEPLLPVDPQGQAPTAPCTHLVPMHRRAHGREGLPATVTAEGSPPLQHGSLLLFRSLSGSASPEEHQTVLDHQHQ